MQGPDLMDIAAADLTDENDRLLLEAQRAAAREDWGPVMAAADEVLKNAAPAMKGPPLSF
jgi:hypothetical protein